MKLAVISDIHGNLEALTVVLHRIEQLHIDKIYCLGDVIGYGCDPIACLDLVSENASVKLMGNHEHSVLGVLNTEKYTNAARLSTVWTQDILTDRELAMIAEFEITHESDNSVFVHSSPYEPDKWHYILKNEDAANAFDYFSGPLCFYGHTHLPMIYSELPGRLPRRQAGHDFDPMEDSRYLVNVGSVGQPRDNDPRACFVTYDTEVITVEYHRVEYDIAKAQAKMTQFQLPTTLIERLAIGR